MSTAVATPSPEECLRLIGRLPHAAHISPDDALRWVRLTMNIEPERIAWHIKRAGGIGGSEAGTLVAWQYGDFHSRGSVERMGNQKLLVLPPDRQNDDTGRGAFLEDHIRDIYERKLTAMGRTWRRLDHEKALVESGPHPDYPWLRASLDGLYEIDGAVTLVDFKSPSEDSLQEYLRHRDFHDYRAQLNHYALVADGHGVPIDALELAMYDYRRVARVGCEVFSIEIDPVLQQKIVAASSVFWNDFIMRGIVPQEPRPPVLRANEGVPEHVHALARRAVVSKIALDKLSKDYEGAREDIAHWVGTVGTLGDGILPLGSFVEGEDGFLQVTAKRTLDVEAAVARLRDLGVSDKDIEAMRGEDKYDNKKVAAAYDVTRRLLAELAEAAQLGKDISDLLPKVDKALKGAPVREKGDFDVDKVIFALESLHETPYTFFTEKISSGLPRGKRQDLEERRALVAAETDHLIDALVACEQMPEELPEGVAMRR